MMLLCVRLCSGVTNKGKLVNQPLCVGSICADFTCEPGDNFNSWQKKKKNSNCLCQKQASLLPSHFLPQCWVFTKRCSQRENIRDHRIQAQYSNYPKSLLQYILYSLSEGPCIYSTYVVPPATEGLISKLFLGIEIKICDYFLWKIPATHLIFRLTSWGGKFLDERKPKFLICHT